MRSEIIIFQHVAKTAGSSLAEVLAARFSIESQLAVVPGATASVLGTWPSEVVAHAWGRLSAPQQEAVRFVGGHLRFGVHEVFRRPTRYITVLRDPVDRVLSSFFYSIGRHHQMTGETVSLEDYVFRRRHYDLGLNNYQTRVISGLSDLDPFEPVTTATARPISEDDLAVAMENVRNHYLLVGATENLQGFLARLARLMGWPRECAGEIPRRNVTPSRPVASEVSSEVLAEIRKHNEFDSRLYDFATKFFDDVDAR